MKPLSVILQGYLDPEYFLTHKLTDKSDVYSLGVVFLEILTGMHPIMHGKNIVREVHNCHLTQVCPFSIGAKTSVRNSYTASNKISLPHQVNSSFQSGTIFSVIDSTMGSYPSDCVEKFVTLALRCCQDETDSRPSMAEVVRQLENIWLMMPESDTRTSESVITPKSGVSQTPSTTPSSSEVKNPYLSFDVSGSNLDSGVIPTIVPR